MNYMYSILHYRNNISNAENQPRISLPHDSCFFLRFVGITKKSYWVSFWHFAILKKKIYICSKLRRLDINFDDEMYPHNKSVVLRPWCWCTEKHRAPIGGNAKKKPTERSLFAIRNIFFFLLVEILT